MKRIAHLVSAVVMVLAGCDGDQTPSTETRDATTSAQQPLSEPSPQATTTDAPMPTPTAGVAGDSGVVAPEEVNMDVEEEENRLVKAEVLARIDLMPELKDEEKDKLYVQVERARGMGKMMTVHFGTAAVAISDRDVEALNQILALEQFLQFAEDPTVVFVVLGFADKAGDPDRNLVLSRARAESVVKALKDRCGVRNVVHSVGMGSSEMFDAAELEKNRVVEIWAVLP